MDESLLPPRRESRPRPWRAVAAVFIPFAGLAAGSGLSRAFDPPEADFWVRWLLWSSLAGLLSGAVWGLFLRRPALWLAYGAVAPGAAAGLVVAGIRAAQPVREWVADAVEARCRAAGSRVCSVREFDAACAARDRAALGPPVQSWCAGESCTERWTYGGPFRPDTWPRRTTLVCSVTSGAGGPRSSVIAVSGAR